MDADITSQAVGLASNTDFSILSSYVYKDIENYISEKTKKLVVEKMM